MRICSRPGCGGSLEHLRADALYCNSGCRREVARQGGSEALSLLQGSRSFWHSYAAVRSRRSARSVPRVRKAAA